MLKIGITGGIGAGKSLVAKVFNVLGVPVYDADKRAKWLMNSDPYIIKEIKLLFGEQSYTSQGLDSRFIAGKVFNNQPMLDRLNAIVHPQVGLDFIHWSKEQSGVPYVLKEAALMFEANSDKQLDRVIVVSAPLEVRIKRVLKRDPFRTREQVKAIIDKQMPEQRKVELADFVIINDDKTLIIPQVIEVHNKIVSLS
ncbi:MAG TPA: dephospho-CoA kinase [Cytophagaceae bacterium]